MSIDWQGHWKLGEQSDTYLEADYREMHCELFFNDRLGTAPLAWDWSFYDDNSDDPETAVATSDEGFPTKEAAEADLIDYINGYVGERQEQQ